MVLAKSHFYRMCRAPVYGIPEVSESNSPVEGDHMTKLPVSADRASTLECLRDITLYYDACIVVAPQQALFTWWNYVRRM